MRYPQMQEISRQTTCTENWLGYHHGARIREGESYDEWNMSADEAPILCPRKKRGIYARPTNAQGLIAKDNLCWVDGSKFVMDGYEFEMNLSERPEDCPKRLVSMGAYVIILPDKMYINTKDTNDRGRIEASVEITGGINFVLCDDDGELIENTIASPIAPDNPSDGQHWIDTGSNPNALMVWSSAEGMWVQVGSTYVKVSATGIGRPFADGDGVSITGLEDSENEEIAALMGSHVIWKRGEDYIVIIGMLGREVNSDGSLSVSRTMPLMDHVIESGNRLWGCRYGFARNGEVVNEIYASKLGDFKNWDVFQGISTDSWVGQCGTDGQWTGAVNYLGYPVFFKEDHIHTVYGSLPSQYSIRDTAARGVQRGSERSLAMVNEVLIYKSRTGVCVYDGSLPTDISEAFGQEKYSKAVAGAHGNRYYISMVNDASGEAALFTYDMKLGLWHREDDMRATDWCSAREHMYCINEAGNIISVTGAGEPESEPLEWEVITGEIGLTQNNGFAVMAMPEEKYIAKVALRMKLEPHSLVRIAVEYDGSGIWEHLASMQGRNLRSFTVPIRPRRCDWLRLKISGVGMARIYSMAKTIEGGSDDNDHDGAVLDF